MKINADFSKRIVVHGADLEWQDSPMAGVKRRMLDRIGDEVARATTLVSYAPNSHFSPHVHSGGEEFLVLEGTFQDEHGDFPAGSYVRNPPTSKHTPGSQQGCVIFVKLWQFEPGDRTAIVTHIDKVGPIEDPKRPGVQVTPLYQDARERVRVERWSPHHKVAVDAAEGAEVFVIEGTFSESGDTLKRHSWLRVPIGGTLQAEAGAAGALVWIKTAHLRFAQPPALS